MAKGGSDGFALAEYERKLVKSCVVTEAKKVEGFAAPTLEPLEKNSKPLNSAASLALASLVGGLS